MGGWMTYNRARNRNGLKRKPLIDSDPYYRDELNGMLSGDFNRMERDYLNPTYPSEHYATRTDDSDPLSQASKATGIDKETIRQVLQYVFIEQD